MTSDPENREELFMIYERIWDVELQCVGGKEKLRGLSSYAFFD